MLQSAVAALILVGLYRFMKSGSEYEVDWWMAFIFVLAPSLLNLLLLFVGALFELPPEWAIAGYALYLVIPFLMLKFGLNYSTRAAFKFSIVVPIVVIATEIPIAMLLGNNAV